MTWKEGRRMIPEVESVDAVAAASAGLQTGSELDA